VSPWPYVRDVEDVYFVLDGAVTVGWQQDGETVERRLGARDLIFNPAGRPHYFRNDGVADAEFTMVVGSPNRRRSRSTPRDDADARLGQATFSYLDQGRGTAVVLLHGIGSAARSFDRQIGALSPRHRVVAWDAPGYGSSTALAPASPTAGDYAGVLAGFLDALGVDACHLLGHSLGS
jgi:Predicted hydrolases or acyltransferases (alpha/beta hydrolase superfamily)